MDPEIYARISQLEKESAVTMDRTSRHDDEIRAMATDLKGLGIEVTSLKSSVESGFRKTQDAMDHIVGAITDLKTDTAANTKKRVSIEAVAAFIVIGLGVVGGLVSIYIRLGG